MFIASLIIYVIVSILIGPMWPIDLFKGKAGPIGYILVSAWIALFIAGLLIKINS